MSNSRNTLGAACGLLLVMGLWAGMASPVFAIEDQVVSAPGATIPDPEFDPVGNQLVYQDRTGNVWVVDLDPKTGDLLQPDGRGEIVATGALSLNQARNGPEWVYQSGEPFVVFIKAFEDTTQIAISRRDRNGTWRERVLEKTIGRYQPVGIQSTNRDAVRFVYGQPDQQAVSIRLGTSPSSESVLLDVSSPSARWIEGERRLMYFAKVDDQLQLFEYAIDSGETTQITQPPGDWVFSHSWHSPVLGGPQLVTSRGATELTVWRRIAGQWRMTHAFETPGSKTYVNSPEGFFYNGLSYLTFVTTNTPKGPPQDDSEIWVAQIQPNGRIALRQVDEPGTGHTHLDPEFFVTSQGPVVFYNERDATTKKSRLRRVDFGLGPPQSAANLVITVLPNRQEIALGDSLEIRARVENRGNLPASRVLLQGQIPHGLDVLNLGARCALDSQLTCKLGTLRPGAWAEVSFDLLAGAEGAFVPRLEAVTAVGESSLADNVTSLELNVPDDIPPAAYMLNVGHFGGDARIVSRPAGINCPGFCTAMFNNGEHVSLTIRPEPGSELLSWTPPCDGEASNICRFEMLDDFWIYAGLGQAEQPNDALAGAP